MGDFNLGSFGGQLTADELSRAYAAAGGRPDELFPAAPSAAPAPTPVAQPAPDMSVQRAGGGSARAIQSYDAANLADANRRIEIAGRSGDAHGQDRQSYDAQAELRGKQAITSKRLADDAESRVASRREHEDRYQADADRLYEDMRAHAQPPGQSTVEKVMGIVSAVGALGGKSGMAQGAQMLGSMLGGGNMERWAAEQQANKSLYTSALGMVGSDREGQTHDLQVAQQMTALRAHEIDAGLEQVKAMGLGRNAERTAADLQLQLRTQVRTGLRAMEADKLKAQGAGAKNQKEEYFWSLPLEQLRQMPSQVLGKDGAAVLAARVKQDLSDRGGEVDIEAKRAAMERDRAKAAGEAPLQAGQVVPGGRKVRDPQLYSLVEKPTLAKYVEGENKARSALSNLESLKQLVAKHGTETMPGEIKNRMETLAWAAKLDLKDAGELGTLDKGSAEVLSQMIGDPTAWNFGLGNAVEGMDSKIAEVTNMVQRQAETRAKGLGLEYNGSVLGEKPATLQVGTGGGVSRSALPQGGTDAAPVTLVSPDGKTFQVHPSRVAKLSAMGWSAPPVAGGSFIAQEADPAQFAPQLAGR